MRNFLMTVGLIVGLFASNLAAADEMSDRLTERTLGDPEAPVTIYEYSSLTCPHCASFHRDTLPQIKEQYIDTGKVKLVFRDFPFDQAALAGAMTARCLPDAQFFPFIDMLFNTQRKWAGAQDPIGALSLNARLAGLQEEGFKSCLSDRDLQTKILERRQEAEKEHGVRSTPTFVINGETVVGAQPFGTFERAIEAALP
ncbi:MAG: DsbA family protein [Magnetospiraceae bacterium]